nr:cytochrome P450 CYP72A219-like [Tanacetum cinerariifolium]
MVRAKELFTWNPSFIDNKEKDYASEEESDFVPNNNDPNNRINEEVFGDVYGSDDDGVPETVFGSNTSSPNQVDGGKENSKSEDPFGIYDILSNKKDNVTSESRHSLSHPPGFTPEGVVHHEMLGSMLGVMENFIRIGQAMGYAMEGSVNDLATIIGLRLVVLCDRPKAMEKYLRGQGLNGNSYRFLFGDVKEMVHMTTMAKSKPIKLTDNILQRVMPFVYTSAKTHGNSFFTWMGPLPMVHITEPALIREILANNYLFQKARGGNPLTMLLARGLLAADTDQWAKHRKIINPAFHVEKLKHMLPAFYISCSEMITKWEGMTKGRSCEVDVFPHLQTFTSDVISRTSFGSSYVEGRKIFELQQEQAQLVIKAIQSIYIPGSQFLPTKSNRRMKEIARSQFLPTKSNRRMKEIARNVKSLIKEIILKRVTAMKMGESSKEDLLGILLDSNYKEIKQQGNNKPGLSIDDVIEECKLFYVAGQETTANLLVWTMILLGQHTNWQDRARDEVLNVFKDKKPDIDGLSRLKVINMILQEVLRLYPPGVGMLRMIYEETKIGNITLPAGSLFMLHMMLLHHDPDIWGDDVNEFNPDRFAEGVSKAGKGLASYFPFGGGPRICIGQNFAMLEVKMALAMILQRFSFEISPSYSHAPDIVLTLQPQFGAQLILCEL